MKKKIILLPLIGAMIYVVLSGSSAGAGLYSGVEGTGASGAPGCSCHSGAATASTTVSIQLYSGTTLVTNYTGGASYTVRITGTQISGSLTLPKFGFQVAAVNTGTSTNAGTLSAIAGTHPATVSGINLVEQSSAMSSTTGTGGSGTTYVVNIPWTAPAAGTGSVTLFGVINSVNGNGGSGGDKWNNSSLVVPEAVAAVAPITGTFNVCIGSTTALSDATTGGTWSSSAPTKGSISTTGVVTGIASGTTTITYTVGPNTVTAVVTINPLPAAVTGTLKVCPGHTTTLADVTTGGSWTSATTSIATVGTSTGVVTGVAAGTSVISYTLTTGCFKTVTVTVNTVAACKTGVPVSSAFPDGLNVYPNPSHDGNFTLNLVSGYEEEATVVITNIFGAKIKEFTIRTNQSADVSACTTPGFYLVNVFTEHERYVAKVMVQ